MRGLGRFHEQVQLSCPGDEGIYCLLAFLRSLRPFEAVQDFIANVDAGTRFMLAQERDGVCQVADNSPVAGVKLAVEAQLGWILHGPVTAGERFGSCVTRMSEAIYGKIVPGFRGACHRAALRADPVAQSGLQQPVIGR